MAQHQCYTEVRDTVSIEYNRVEGDSRTPLVLVQKITVERIFFELVTSASHELTRSQRSIGGDIDTLSCRSCYESSCDVLTRSCGCDPTVYDDHSCSFSDYCSSDDNSKVSDYIRKVLNTAQPSTLEPTVAPCIELSCSESTCNDTLARSICYQSTPDDTNTCKCCLNRYFGSDGISNVQEVPNFLGVLTSTQQRTERTLMTKIKSKAGLGKLFTEFLVQLCNISIEAIKHERNVVSNTEVYKQYTEIIVELADAIILLMIIRHKFCSVHAGQEQQSDDILQYVLLPILLDTATKTADVIKTTLQSLWRTWLPSNVGIMLLTYAGISQVVNGVNDVDCKSFCEVVDIIEQLKTCLDKIDTLKNMSKAFNINTDCIAWLCSQERRSLELSIGQ